MPTAPAEQPHPDLTTPVDQLQPYTSTDGRFSVMFPGIPTKSAQQVSLSENDAMTLRQFQFDEIHFSYLVMYCDYPAKYVTGEPRLILEGIRDSSIESFKATLTSDEPIDLSGVPGRAFNFTDKDGSSYVARDFLNGQRLYQVIVTVGAGSSTTQAEAFVNSFRIL